MMNNAWDQGRTKYLSQMVTEDDHDDVMISFTSRWVVEVDVLTGIAYTRFPTESYEDMIQVDELVEDDTYQ